MLRPITKGGFMGISPVGVGQVEVKGGWCEVIKGPDVLSAWQSQYFSGSFPRLEKLPAKLPLIAMTDLELDAKYGEKPTPQSPVTKELRPAPEVIAEKPKAICEEKDVQAECRQFDPDLPSVLKQCRETVKTENKACREKKEKVRACEEAKQRANVTCEIVNNPAADPLHKLHSERDIGTCMRLMSEAAKICGGVSAQ